MVADTANGMGGLVVPKVFEGLPFELEVLFAELDGTFPNHPADPIQPENLVDLKQAVLDSSADIGLAFDGDADRVFLVDERARPVSGSLTTALVASSMLDKHPGATVLYNCICSRVVPEVIAEKGGTGIRTKVGHSFIKQVMADTGAVFGGEHSGHYYFRDNFRADSGIIAAMVVLELLSVSGKPLSELLAPFQRYADSGEINTVVDDPARAVELMAAEVEAAGGALGLGRPSRRSHRGPGRLVVQPPAVEHRATAPPQRGGARRALLCRARVRGRGRHQTTARVVTTGAPSRRGIGPGPARWSTAGGRDRMTA